MKCFMSFVLHRSLLSIIRQNKVSGCARILRFATCIRKFCSFFKNFGFDCFRTKIKKYVYFYRISKFQENEAMLSIISNLLVLDFSRGNNVL